MKNLKALALTALAATTLIIAAPKAEAGVAMCDQAFKTGYAGTCYDMNGTAWTNAQEWKAGTGFQGNVGATTTMHAAPAPVATYQRPTYEQFERKCNVYSNSYIRKGNYGNTLECVSNGSSVATWSRTGYGF